MRRLFVNVILVLLAPACLTSSAWAQEEFPAGIDPDSGMSQQELQQLAAQAVGDGTANVAMPDAQSLTRGSINFLNLLIEGGVLMIPIAVMSLLVVAVSIERAFALRKSRVFPKAIRRAVRFTQESSESVTPQELFDVAMRHPSPAARVMQDTLQKVGRPVPEMEMAISEGAQREAETLFSHVRWLTLAAAVTPLIGLLGTVWGMIIALYNTTQLGAGSNKAEFLAEGIYVALVTTLGGLAVAIPAAIFAHYFEGKISRLLNQIEAEYRRMVPRFESLEGKMRYDLGPTGLRPRTAADVKPERAPEELDSEITAPIASAARSPARRA